jgi:hypothetical protein
MARKRRARKPPPEKTPLPVQPTDETAAIYLAALLIGIVVSFYPLIKYFFAQDDFVLLHTAVRDSWLAVTDYFARVPGMFRPLTKAVYFDAMYRVFGLNPVPFHVVSIVLHAINTAFFFLLMWRVRVTTAGALVSTTLFALSVAFFHVIAWISCIQQLLGECFMLASLLWGIDYLRRGRARARWASLGAYVLALLSIEQTFGVPVILLLYAWLAPDDWGRRMRPVRAVNKLLPHLAVMALYLLFIGVWKTAPRSGSYAFTLGPNVAVNLLTYLGWSLQFGVVLPSVMATGKVSWHVSHILLCLLGVYHLIRRRSWQVVFGFSFFVVAVSPTLLLSNHTFYLHTYIPSFGVLYLVALFVDDVFALRPFRIDLARLILLGSVLVAMSVTSFVMIRKNERYKMFGFLDSQRSFVLRRATIAKNVHDCVVSAKSPSKDIQKVFMVYGREEGRDEALWNNRNVVAATGQGSLLNLIYESPEMPVEFKVSGDAIAWTEQFVSDIFFFDDHGNCAPMEKPQGER